MTLSIDLNNYRVLVTGVTSGIGAGITKVLAQAGSDVAGCVAGYSIINGVSNDIFTNG